MSQVLDTECSCKDPEEVVRAPGLRWVCSTAGRKQNLQPNSSRFTGGWRQNSLRAVACQEETAMSPKPFIFSSLGAAGCRAWSGDSIPWDCDRIEREKSPSTKRTPSCFTASFTEHCRNPWISKQGTPHHRNG